ncbi:MAG TPA: glycosyltransferase WbuB [Stenomitos sp.]
MRILVYSLNFAPELVGIGKYNADFANWLTKQGHEVQVICAPPYYPTWSVYPGYKSEHYAKQRYRRTTVYRCPIWVPAKPTGLKRILHLLSFAISSLPVLLWRTLAWQPDVIFVLEPPIFCLPSALACASLFDSKVWLHVQDLEIDAGFSLGLVPQSKWFQKLVYGLEGWLLKRTSVISSITDKMLNAIQKKGILPSKCVLFPNWIDTQAVRPLANSSVFREELGIATKQTVCLYSGNLGNKQGLEILIESARLLQSQSNITFVIAGEGSMKEALIQLSSDLNNIVFLPLQPTHRFNELLNLADIHLLPQSTEAADIVFPSKLKAIFASGRPVIATANAHTQLHDIVKGRGLVVPPGNLEAFSQAIQDLSLDSATRLRLGNAARNYAMAHWERNNIMSNVEFRLLALLSPQHLPIAQRRSLSQKSFS